jgi:hypothetical protein
MKRFSLGVAVLSVAMFAATAHANLLDDGSFELGGPAGSPWSSTDNVPDGTDGSLEFSSSVWAASDGDVGIWFKSFEGQQDSADPPANAGISQSVAAPINGDYILTFQSARETNVSADSFPAVLSSDGTGGSASIELLTAVYNDDGNMNSDPTTFSLQLNGVTAGDNLTVSVDMINGIDSLANPQSLMVDNFVLNLIPEPTSLALFGLGVLGVMTTRRNR